MTPTIKIIITSFFIKGLFFSLIMSGLDLLRKEEFSWLEFSLRAVFFGILMLIMDLYGYRQRLKKNDSNKSEREH